MTLTPNQSFLNPAAAANISADITVGGAVTVNGQAVFNGDRVITASSLSMGSATLSSGVTTFNADTLVHSFSMTGGELTGTGNFVLGFGGGGLSWSGGTISGTGTMVTGGEGVSVSGPIVLRRHWTNTSADINIYDGGEGSTFGRIEIAAEGALTNFAGRTIDISSTGSPGAPQIYGAGPFTNNGTLAINADTAIAAGTYNNGAGSTVSFPANFTLTIIGGGSDAGNYSIGTGGGSIVFTGGTRNFAGGGISGGGSLTVSGGAVNIPDTTILGMNTLNVTGGALTVDRGGVLNLTNPNFTGGTATFNGGPVDFSGVVNVTTGATLTGSSNFNGGTMNWTGGTIAGTGLMTTGSLTVPGTGTLGRAVTASNIINDGIFVNTGTTTGDVTNNGTLKGTGTISGSVINNGTVAPGNSPGILVITGNYTQASTGTLQIEIGGTTPGSGYDQLQVSGNANLAGTLVVTQFGTFVPMSANTFQPIVTGTGSVSGAFANVVVPPVFSGLAASYLPLSVNLSGAVGAVTTVAPDPRIVKEDKDIFVLVGEDTDIFEKLLGGTLVCN